MLKLPDARPVHLRDQVTAYTGRFWCRRRTTWASAETAAPKFASIWTRPLGPRKQTIAVGFHQGGSRRMWVPLPAFSAQCRASFCSSRLLRAFRLPALCLEQVRPRSTFRHYDPLFHPPENLSAAALSYAQFQTAFGQEKGIQSSLSSAALLVALAVKRFFLRHRRGRACTVTLLARDSGQPAETRPCAACR